MTMALHAPFAFIHKAIATLERLQPPAQLAARLYVGQRC
jgi:hypothetical protein